MTTHEYPVLDHGYVKLIESWGSDERIIEAARMSTAKGFLGWGPMDDGICSTCGGAGRMSGEGRAWDCGACSGTGRATKPGDEKLLKFLWDNQHGTPFEMAGAIIEVEAPIVVFREWHRHRLQSYNELSARYTPLPCTNYMPTTDRLLMGSDGKNKQAGTVADAEVLTLESALEWQVELADVYDHAERVYQSGLRRGVPKELARLPVPVARYSRMRASANVRHWLTVFARQRSDKNPKAQWEIRQYANILLVILRDIFPRSVELFDGGK